MILVVDNYDSFVHNLARYLQRLGQETVVIRNDVVEMAEIRRLAPSAIVLSPGPCTPDEAGCCLDLVRQLGGEIPLLGVCLGHQVIGQALGASVVRAPQAVHGRSSWIRHTGDGLFSGLPDPLRVGRYHSLMVDRHSLPKALQVTATTDDGLVMAVEHRADRIFGLQFHPESVLTQFGYQMLAAFLDLAGISHHSADPIAASERLAPDDFAKPTWLDAARSAPMNVSWPDAYPVLHWRHVLSDDSTDTSTDGRSDMT